MSWKVNSNDSKIKDLNKIQMQEKGYWVKKEEVTDKVDIGLVMNGKKDSMSIRYFRSENLKMYK